MAPPVPVPFSRKWRATDHPGGRRSEGIPVAVRLESTSPSAVVNMQGMWQTLCQRDGMSEEPQKDPLASIEWQPRDTGWVACVAFLPILLLVVSVLAAGLESNRWPMLGDVLITWVFVGAFGLVVFVPATMV
ncbi:hypothetical protein ERC79_02345 [Rhodococcus sp. ABRD24]|uniref:hypothetical protein n=1 Tax=Rhodococcus sp. ABRD24 TaxID=2507582 RepID=UPI00103B50A8|nr:hypothetical protein [Rhodococcus sp. ABRD24]QBJ94931.1 hypothetical protein ERC79_02345 [Rhodococcus sp. ABRD24]